MPNVASISYINPSVTLGCPKGVPFDPKLPYVTSDYPLIVLKDLNPNNSANYYQRIQLLLQKSQPFMCYDRKSHLMRIYSSIIYPCKKLDERENGL